MKDISYYAYELRDISVDLIHAIENEKDIKRVQEILEVVEAIYFDCKEAAKEQGELL